MRVGEAKGYIKPLVEIVKREIYLKLNIYSAFVVSLDVRPICVKLHSVRRVIRAVFTLILPRTAGRAGIS